MRSRPGRPPTRGRSHAGQRHVRVVPRRQRRLRASTHVHVPTTAACETCHATVAWKPANFTHEGIVGRLRQLPRRRARQRARAAAHRHDGLRGLPRDHRLEAGDEGRPRQRARQLLDLPRRTRGEGQARQPHPDHGRVRQLPRDHARGRPRSSTTPASPATACHATTARVPRGKNATHLSSSTHLRVVPRRRCLEAGLARRSRPGARHLLLLPRRHAGRRQERRPTFRPTTTCDSATRRTRGAREFLAHRASPTPAPRAMTARAPPARARRTSSRAPPAEPVTQRSRGAR